MSIVKNMIEERRKSLRISYHPSERPVFQIGKDTFWVVDLNETGMAIEGADALVHFEEIRGRVLFRQDESMGVEGVVVWRKNNRWGIEFNHPIPASIILREHQRRAQNLR